MLVKLKGMLAPAARLLKSHSHLYILEHKSLCNFLCCVMMYMLIFGMNNRTNEHLCKKIHSCEYGLRTSIFLSR